MTITINGTTGITTPEITLDNTAADGGQVVLKSSGSSNWNLDNYSGRLRAYYGSTEYMTINSSGNVGIGTSSPAYKLHVYDGTSASIVASTPSSDVQIAASSSGFGLIGTVGNYPLVMRTNGTERARIDSSGNLLVGTTAQVSGLGASVSTMGRSNNCTFAIQGENAAGYNARLYMECPGSNAGGLTYQRGTSRLYAYSQTENSGPYVVANGTSWTTNSDERLKTDIVDITYGLNAVMELAPKQYKYKTGDKTSLGLIAQQAVLVIPEIVEVPEDAEAMMGIEYTGLIPVLVKAIQELAAASVEQQAIITQLQADVAALKGQA